MLTSKEKRYISLCIVTEMRRYIPCFLEDKYILKIAREAVKKFQPTDYTPEVHAYCTEMVREYMEGVDPYGKTNMGRKMGV